jgi:hypothetical protein
MRISLAGIGFDISPESEIREAEHRLVASFAADCEAEFSLSLENGSFPPASDVTPEAAGNAELLWRDADTLSIRHPLFRCEIILSAKSIRLTRSPAADFAIHIALRSAVAAILPSRGGAIVHAAGVVIRGEAYVFFGPSGAGQTTLSATAPHRLLSDESVAILAGDDAVVARASGFWGDLGDREPVEGDYPLAALIELGKAPAFSLAPIEPARIVPRLLKVLTVPLSVPLWNEAIALAGRITASTPLYRVEWAAPRFPWDEFIERIDHADR